MEIKLYTTREIEHIVSSVPVSHINTFLSNPFLYEGAPIQLRAEEDGKVLGSVFAFPMEVVSKDGEVFSVCAGSTLTVKPDYRGRGIAKNLTLKRLELTKDKVAIASGLSSMSLPLFKKLGFSVFMSKRNILLKNSRPIVEMVFKNGIFSRFFTSFFNLFVFIHAWFLKIECKKAMRGLCIEEVYDVPKEVPDIVASDSSLFRENHSQKWFEWVLKGGFVDDERSKQHLFIVKKDHDVVAFFMTKERFHEQASSRGFKNVVLGSVIEWGVKPGNGLKIEKLLLCSLLSFGDNVDAIELCSSYSNINHYLRRRFLVSVGESNFAVKAFDSSPLATYPEYQIQENWRIRPAASDNSFN